MRHFMFAAALLFANNLLAVAIYAIPYCLPQWMVSRFPEKDKSKNAGV